MRVLTNEKLLEIQKNPDKVRNICIIAHVDHGKTTLADSLVASNGIISPRMAGKLRYMDSRKDEQERGITMKSSSITLYHQSEGGECLINLIDSPGHVDFSSEVSTAVRLCDGAVVVVDVVEGVCPQTQVALKQAWQESIKPVLVLNKIDRLILEMKLTPLDAYVHLSQVLEQVNAVTGELFTTEVLNKAEKEQKKQRSFENDKLQNYDWGDGLEEADDSNLYFNPDQGNVVFASAIDGWGFRIKDFVKLYSTKLGLREDVLEKTLWGDYYFNSKTKRVMRGAQEKAKKPLFVQLVLENIWALYDTLCIRKDKTKVASMTAAIGVNLTARDLRHTDPKVQLQAIFSQWLPLSRSVLDMVFNILPPANRLSEEKVEKLMCSNNQNVENYPLETQSLKEAFMKCSSEESDPVIVFVSKMFPIERKFLPKNKPAAITNEELAARRELARIRHAEKMANLNETKSEETNDENQEIPSSDDEFIAFARVYSGILRKGMKLYVLGPKHDPETALQHIRDEGDIPENLMLKDLKSGHHATKVLINDIYLMMGRDLESIDEAPAGNVVGIGGLEEHILKSATLSSVIYCPSFSELNIMAVPILRVAVEPKRHSDLPALIKGLKLLNQADACVQVLVQETGEHVLVTAGEVHLERCVDDLVQRYAKVEINVSEPIIPFRETVVPPPTTDMVNETIDLNNKKNDDCDENGVVMVTTPSKQSFIKIVCTPIPDEITQFLEKNSNIIKIIDKQTSSKHGELMDKFKSFNLKENVKERTELPKKIVDDILAFKQEFCNLLKNCSGILSENNIFDKIWSFGPRRCGPNLLINLIDGYDRSIWKESIEDHDKLFEYDSSFLNGFQMASLAGPLCEEPLMGVAFVVKEWKIDLEVPTSGTYGPLSGQIMSAVKEGCRRSFQAQPQRLMAAMYTCNIQANSEVLGKMYAVLGRRHGRVLAGDMTQGSASFTVTAVLPVIESFSFAQEIRKQTSGLASPQLVFSHWEVIDMDPFWSPSTEEEYLHYGEKADTENKALQYMNSVRRRKGLPVKEKIIQHAEKQRTLKTNK